MQIGDVLYTRDTNRRHFVADEYGNKHVDPAGYWREHTIIGETRQSWVLSGGEGYKVDKQTMRLRVRELYGMDARAYTLEEKEDCAWRDEHAANVRRLVERADTAMLRKIAALIGYNS